MKWCSRVFLMNVLETIKTLSMVWTTINGWQCISLLLGVMYDDSEYTNNPIFANGF